jgi:ribonuclease HI
MIMGKFGKIYIYTDGGSRGNPGPGAIGILILDEGKKILYRDAEYIGETTNNRAEYTALIEALKKAKKYTKGEVNCFSDSKLMVKQLQGEFKIKSYFLKNLHQKVKELEKNFKRVNYNHVRREDRKIAMADELLNQALDENGK